MVNQCTIKLHALVLIVDRTEFFARIADKELILHQQQILLSQQCTQRFQEGTHYAVNHMVGGLQIFVLFSHLPDSPNKWQL